MKNNAIILDRRTEANSVIFAYDNLINEAV